MARKIKSVASESSETEQPTAVPELKEEADDFDFVDKGDDEDGPAPSPKVNYVEMPSGRAVVAELIDDQTGQIYLAAAKCVSRSGMFDSEDGRLIALNKVLAQWREAP